MSDRFLHVKDIMEITGFKEGKCRSIIRELNSELAKKGYFTFQGRVSEQYFYERCFPKKEKALEELADSTSAKQKQKSSVL